MLSYRNDIDCTIPGLTEQYCGIPSFLSVYVAAPMDVQDYNFLDPQEELP